MTLCLEYCLSKIFSFISTDTDVVERQVFNKGSPCIFKCRLDSTAIGLALAAANRATRKPDKSLKGLPGLMLQVISWFPSGLTIANPLYRFFVLRHLSMAAHSWTEWRSLRGVNASEKSFQSRV